ncbi:MAG: YceI family protein [Chloroflexi bacterium]|nr:MAG: YceI family protein [Chloroflexota bacterium]
MGTWKFDPFHTQVEFSAKHLGMMTVRGHFNEVTATGEIHPDDPTRTKVEATINTASIRTHNEQRDKDLRSSNFLEIDKFPTMTFKSTRIGYAAETRINRKEFGMNFDAMLDGKFVVSNEVNINIEGEIVEAAESESEVKREAGASKKS